MFPGALESRWIVIPLNVYLQEFLRGLGPSQAVIHVYNTLHVVCVSIQRFTRLIDNDQVALTYLSEKFPNGPAQNEDGKQLGIATGIRGL